VKETLKWRRCKGRPLEGEIEMPQSDQKESDEEIKEFVGAVEQNYGKDVGKAVREVLKQQRNSGSVFVPALVLKAALERTPDNSVVRAISCSLPMRFTT